MISLISFILSLLWTKRFQSPTESVVQTVGEWRSPSPHTKLVTQPILICNFPIRAPLFETSDFYQSPQSNWVATFLFVLHHHSPNDSRWRFVGAPRVWRLSSKATNSTVTRPRLNWSNSWPLCVRATGNFLEFQNWNLSDLKSIEKLQFRFEYNLYRPTTSWWKHFLQFTKEKRANTCLWSVADWINGGTQQRAG